jgi:RNA recognition motif-containing protein
MSLFATPNLEHFLSFGDTVRVEIKRNFALIEYKNLEDAVEAREKLHNTKLGDRMLVVGYKARDRDRQERGWGEEERERERERDREREREGVRGGGAGGYRRDDKVKLLLSLEQIWSSDYVGGMSWLSWSNRVPRDIGQK